MAATVVIDHLCSEYFDHQDSGTFRYLLALAPCHNAIHTNSLHNPEPQNLLPCFQREKYYIKSFIFLISYNTCQQVCYKIITLQNFTYNDQKTEGCRDVAPPADNFV